MKNFRLIIFLVLIPFVAKGKNEFSNNHQLGSISVPELLENYEIFKRGYESYIPAEFGEMSIEGINVKIFFGTWCHDSKREVPKALKIFNDIGINDENIELIAVGLDKKEPLGRASKLNLMYTPTLIFFRGSKEIGRIIEKPVISLEKDIELIISSI